MIPFFLIPKLNNIEILIFQLIQSFTHLGIFIALVYLGLNVLQRDRSIINIKNIIITGIIIEIADLIISFNSIFLLIGGGYSIVITFFYYPTVESGILYLRYYKKREFSVLRVIILYGISCIPAIIASVFITNVIFDSMGIEAFIFIYQFA